jgi:uncharacterized protein (UPF0335 family)
MTGEETMAIETTYSGTFGSAQRFHTSLETVREIPHLETGRLRLGETLGRAEGLFTEQASLTAAKQEISQELKTAIKDVQLLATVLRKAVRQHFGKRSEKLAEFGLQPFRGRKAANKPTPPPEPTPASTDL